MTRDAKPSDRTPREETSLGLNSPESSSPEPGAPEALGELTPQPRRPGPAGRHILLAGVAGACALGVGLGLWARPGMNERRALATAEPSAPAPASGHMLQVVLDDHPLPVGAPIEVLPAAARPAPATEPQVAPQLGPQLGQVALQTSAPSQPAPPAWTAPRFSAPKFSLPKISPPDLAPLVAAAVAAPRWLVAKARSLEPPQSPPVLLAKAEPPEPPAPPPKPRRKADPDRVAARAAAHRLALAQLAEEKAADRKAEKAKAAEVKLALAKANRQKAAQERLAEARLAEAKLAQQKLAQTKSAEARAVQIKLAKAEAAKAEHLQELADARAQKQQAIRLAKAEAKGRAEALAEAKAQAHAEALAEAREEAQKQIRLASLVRTIRRVLPHEAKPPPAPVETAKLDHKHARKPHRDAAVQQASLKPHKTPHPVEPPTRSHPAIVVPPQHPSGLMKVSAPRCASRDPGEALVCADPNLGAADRQLARAYQDARAAGVPEAKLRDQQLRWLAARSAAAREAPWAVHDVYLARIAELNGQAREAHGDGY